MLLTTSLSVGNLPLLKKIDLLGFVFACIYSDHSIYECVCLHSHLNLLCSCPGKCVLLSLPESNALSHTKLLKSPILKAKNKTKPRCFILHILYSVPAFDFIAQVLKRMFCTLFPPGFSSIPLESSSHLHPLMPNTVDVPCIWLLSGMWFSLFLPSWDLSLASRTPFSLKKVPQDFSSPLFHFSLPSLIPYTLCFFSSWFPLDPL